MDRIEDVVDRMKPGQCLEVGLMQFASAWPANPLTGETSHERFLSRRLGSAYGAWRIDQRLGHDTLIISRVDEDSAASHDGFLYHVDADRRWMFDRVPGGWRRRPPPSPIEAA